MEKDLIRVTAAKLSIGETLDNEWCPFCQASHEKKLSITRVEGGLLYNCYRAKCGQSGYIPEKGVWEQRKDPQKPVNRPYTGGLRCLNFEEIRFFHEAFGVTGDEYVTSGMDLREEHHIRVATKYGYFAFPLTGPSGKNRGWLLRQPSWKGIENVPLVPTVDKGRVLTYKNKGSDPNISWVRIDPAPNRFVLVEDWLSARKVSQTRMYTGIALNGVSANYQAISEIAKEDPLTVSIWLDPGAERAAWKLYEKWGLTFNFCNVIVGDKDPKYYTESEIRSMLDVGW